MTEQRDPTDDIVPADASPESADVEYDLPENQDWLLTQLVSWAELGLATGVTLLVDGQIVSGILEKETAYIESLRSDFSQGLGGAEVSASVDTAFVTMLSSIAERDEHDGARPYPKFAHLRDARIFMPGAAPLPTNKAVWMRVKIAAVGSFSLGNLSHSS